MTDDLVAWLRERLIEDADVDADMIRQVAQLRDYAADQGLPHAMVFLDQFGPARMVREVAAKRQIMLIHRRPPVGLWGGGPFEDCCDGCGYSGEFSAPNVRHIGDCPELRALAAVYADRPGFREEWR